MGLTLPLMIGTSGATRISRKSERGVVASFCVETSNGLLSIPFARITRTSNTSGSRAWPGLWNYQPFDDGRHLWAARLIISNRALTFRNSLAYTRATGGQTLPPFRLLHERTTRSLVFEEKVIQLLEQYAAARQRSLSSVVREAVVRFLESEDPHDGGSGREVPDGTAKRTNGKTAEPDP